MIKLSVPDMTCSHCAGVITKAIKSLDAAATVSVDYDSKVVSVETSAAAAAVAKAVDGAGYPNQAL